MRLLFQQRLFSWFDSYDIYDEEGRTVYTVEGKLSWGHRLEIYGPAGDHLGTVKEEVLTDRKSTRLHSEGVHPLQATVPAGVQRLAGGRGLLGVGLSGDRPRRADGHDGLQGALSLDGHLYPGHTPCGGFFALSDDCAGH